MKKWRKEKEERADKKDVNRGAVGVLRRKRGVQVAASAKKETRERIPESPLGGDYLRLPMSLTIGVVRIRALGSEG